MDKNFDRKIFEAEVDFDTWGCIPSMILSSLIFTIGCPMLYFAAINFDISRLEGIIYIVVAIAILEFFAWRCKKNAKNKYFDIQEYSTSANLCLCSYKEKKTNILESKA